MKEFAVGQDSVVSVQLVRAFIETAKQIACSDDGKAAMAATVDLSRLEAAAGPVPRSEVYRFCQLAMELTGDRALGLHWGERFPDRAFDVVSRLMTCAGTLRGAFESLFRFSALITDSVGFRVIEDGDRMTARCLYALGAPVPVQRFIAEMTLVGVYRLVRAYSFDARPRRVAFAHTEPDYLDAYAEVFDVPVMFGQPFSEIEFDRSLMDVRLSYDDDGLYDALRAVAERRLVDRTRRRPYASQVRELLLRERAPHRVTMGEIARDLNMSVRSLHRKLAHEGVLYRDIANEASEVIAKRLMLDERRTIQETAFEMGFSDASSFHRAFKRWTGITPGTFREQVP